MTFKKSNINNRDNIVDLNRIRLAKTIKNIEDLNIQLENNLTKEIIEYKVLIKKANKAIQDLNEIISRYKGENT